MTSIIKDRTLDQVLQEIKLEKFPDGERLTKHPSVQNVINQEEWEEYYKIEYDFRWDAEFEDEFMFLPENSQDNYLPRRNLLHCLRKLSTLVA